MLMWPDYTELAMSTVTQRLSVFYTGSLAQLHLHLSQLSGDIERTEDSSGNKGLKVFKAITLIHSSNMVTIEVRHGWRNGSYTAVNHI